MSPMRAWNPMSISIPSSTGEGPVTSYRLTQDWKLSLGKGSGSVLRDPRNVRGRSVRTTTPASCTLFAMAMLLLTSTILGGGELSKGCPGPTLGPGAQGIPFPPPQNAIALKYIQLLVSLYVILPAASPT